MQTTKTFSHQTHRKMHHEQAFVEINMRTLYYGGRDI